VEVNGNILEDGEDGLCHEAGKVTSVLSIY